MKIYPDFRKCLLFVTRMDNGTIETVHIEPREVLEGAKSSDLRNRDRTRQARHMLPPEEWFAFEFRYTRKRQKLYARDNLNFEAKQLDHRGSL